MKRPLLVVIVPYLGGVLLSDTVVLPLPWLFGVAIGCALASVPVFKWRPVMLGATIFLCGWVNLAIQTRIVSPRDLRVAGNSAPELAILEGRLRRTPVHRSETRKATVIWRSVAEIEAAWVTTKGIRRQTHGRMMIFTPGRLGAEFWGGRRVRVEGVLQLPKKAVAEGLFDYREYLRERGIYYQLSTEGPEDWHLNPSAAERELPPVSDRFLNWARSNLAKGIGEPDDPLRLIWAMVLGWKASFSDEIAEPFMRSGTLHIFAISGLHIALITGILMQLLRGLQVCRAASGIVLIPALWFYAFATGWQASAVRATIMMTVVIGGWALSRPADLLNSLAGAALIVLIWDPRQLFQASFQLSFSVVLSIALIVPRLAIIQRRWLAPDPFLPETLIVRWKRALRRCLHYLTGSLIVSVASWLGSFFLIASYFHLVTPISVFANVVIVPLAGVTLMASLGSMLCGDLLPWGTELFNHSAWFWMTLILRFSTFASSVPGAYFYISSPPVTSYLLYYAVLWAVLTGWIFAEQGRRWRVLGASALMIAGTVNMFWRYPEVRITIFPLGGGAVFVDSVGSMNDLLVDCGDRAAAERVLKPFLQAQGFNRLPSVLLTHGDIGHVGGYDYLEQEFGVRRVYTGPASFRSAVYRQIEERLRAAPDVWRKVWRGEVVSDWTVLHPESGDSFSRADDGAVVLYREYFGLRVLLLSDLGRLGQRTLLERGEGLNADIVVAGLPSQDETLLEPLLAGVNPLLIIVASGEFPASNRPSRAVRERLSDSGIPIVYTHLEGSIALSVSGGEWWARNPNGIVAFGDLP